MDFKFWKHCFSTLRKDLKILFFISLFSILIIDFWLINVNEFFPYGATLGSIYYKICFAYITAFIFYFLNIHLQSERNKIKNFKYINNKCGSIYETTRSLLASLRFANNLTPYQNGNPTLSEENLNNLCKGVNPRNNFLLYLPYNKQFHQWTECIDFIDKEIKSKIAELLLVRDTLDSEIVVIFSDIDDYLDRLNISKGANLGNLDITHDSHCIYGLYISTKKLLNIVEKKYKYHQSEYHKNFRKNNSEI